MSDEISVLRTEIKERLHVLLCFLEKPKARKLSEQILKHIPVQTSIYLRLCSTRVQEACSMYRDYCLQSANLKSQQNFKPTWRHIRFLLKEAVIYSRGRTLG